MLIYDFPDIENIDSEGLICISNEINPQMVLQAYIKGIFPWSASPVTWWSPDPRAIFFPKEFKLNKRMARAFKNSDLNYSFDKAFEQVIKQCAQPRANEDSWISPEFIDVYTSLHNLGFAHSVEAWHKDELCGGIYGIAIGGFFAGESMFSKITNASTFCLAVLMKFLNKNEFSLFDTQVINPHTKMLGAKEIPRKEYLKLLNEAINKTP